MLGPRTFAKVAPALTHTYGVGLVGPSLLTRWGKSSTNRPRSSLAQQENQPANLEANTPEGPKAEEGPGTP